jgi:hypothetical protein
MSTQTWCDLGCAMREAFGREFCSTLWLNIGGQNLVECAEALSRKLKFFRYFGLHNALAARNSSNNFPNGTLTALAFSCAKPARTTSRSAT